MPDSDLPTIEIMGVMYKWFLVAANPSFFYPSRPRQHFQINGACGRYPVSKLLTRYFIDDLVIADAQFPVTFQGLPQWLAVVLEGCLKSLFNSSPDLCFNLLVKKRQVNFYPNGIGESRYYIFLLYS